MDKNLIQEAAALENEFIHRPHIVAASIIDSMFTTDVYNYGEALTALSTLNLVGLISDELADRIGTAFRYLKEVNI